jgi:hypothetical protein
VWIPTAKLGETGGRLHIRTPKKNESEWSTERDAAAHARALLFERDVQALGSTWGPHITSDEARVLPAGTRVLAGGSIHTVGEKQPGSTGEEIVRMDAFGRAEMRGKMIRAERKPAVAAQSPSPSPSAPAQPDIAPRTPRGPRRVDPGQLGFAFKAGTGRRFAIRRNRR